MFNFLEEFLKVTSIVESPTSYLEWAAYCTIGAVMRHNVYYDFPSRRTRVTPNIYVLLVGDSGATRKSTPLKIANFLLKSVGNTKLIEGRASIQGVLKELAGVRREGKRTIKDAGAFLYSEEFAAFLVKDPSTSGILTDIYDYKETHQVVLKSEDTMKLEKVCISLLSATNAAFLQDMFTKTDLYGGLVGRTIFIIEEDARHKNLGFRDSTTEKDWDFLTDHLRKLALLEGPVKLTEDAESYLTTWYETTDFRRAESKTGFEHRAHTHVMKMALIFAACEEVFDLTIRKDHCERAIDMISALRQNYHKLIATVGFSNDNIKQAIKDITICLFQSVDNPLSRSQILRSLFGRIDAETFEKAVITLEQSSLITISGSSTPMYALSKTGRETILGEIKVVGKPN